MKKKLADTPLDSPPTRNGMPSRGRWYLKSSIKVRDCEKVIRFLLTKFIREENLNFAEVLLIFNCYFILVEATQRKGTNLNEETIGFLETISLFINELYSPQLCPARIRQYIIDLQKSTGSLLFNFRKYLGLENDLNFQHLYLKWIFVEPSTPTEPSRIGVGYRDKGNRRNLSVAGDLFAIDELAGDDEFKRANWFQKEPKLARLLRRTSERVQRNLKEPFRVISRQRKLTRFLKTQDPKVSRKEREWLDFHSDLL